jgi:signal transduction histidine kinase
MAGRGDGSRPRSVLAALALATILTAFAFVLRLAVDAPDGPSLPGRLMAPLFAAAAICGAALTVRRAPSVAWLATASAAWIAAVEIAGVVRALQPVAGIDRWPVLVTLSAAALVAGLVISARYASLPRARGVAGVARSVALLASLGVAAVVALGSWAIATAATEASIRTTALDDWPVRLTARVALGLMALGIVVGAIRDLAGPVARTRERRRSAAARGTTAAPSSFLGDLADEMLPGRALERRRVVERERARLAADLHALVLPDLRQAVAAAASTEVPGHVAAGLRRSLDGIEQMMHGRQSIVLEEYGLVAALEWLAERTEERSSVRVDLELDGDRVDDRSAVPPDVARMAFRVGLLALDNVVRHAGAQIATVHLSVTADAVEVTVTDDGRAIDPSTSEHGSRGLVDMQTEAEAAGAALSISNPGGGTRVAMTWPAGRAAEIPARPLGNLATRSDAPAP